MGIPTLIGSAHTASGASEIEITSGIDSTYDEYMFVITDWNPADDGYATFFNCSIDGGSNYNVAKTSAGFEVGHGESDAGGSIAFYVGISLAQATGYQQINNGSGSEGDQSLSGIIHLYSPSNITYVKHYTITSNVYTQTDYSYVCYQGGYFNTTSAINAIRFRGYSDGNFDAVIQMYGIA